MRKKPPIIRFPKAKAKAETANRSWHNGADIEIDTYARSLQKAARTLIETLDPEPNFKTAWDAGPVIVLYRQALELRLKALVDEGGKFLPSPTDHLTLYKTHSLRWLSQLVCQIIKAVEWERSFVCEGVASLADFSALVNELEALDPVSCAVQSGVRDGSVLPQLQPPNVLRIAKRLDALLDLLDVTADVMAATWDQRAEGRSLQAGDNIKPSIH